MTNITEKKANLLELAQVYPVCVSLVRFVFIQNKDYSKKIFYLFTLGYRQKQDLREVVKPLYMLRTEFKICTINFGTQRICAKSILEAFVS